MVYKFSKSHENLYKVLIYTINSIHTLANARGAEKY